jgi:hypothetical protein
VVPNPALPAELIVSLLESDGPICVDEAMEFVMNEPKAEAPIAEAVLFEPKAAVLVAEVMLAEPKAEEEVPEAMLR